MVKAKRNTKIDGRYKNIIRALSQRFNVKPSVVYKALGWSRQRYWDTVKNNRPVPLEHRMIILLSEALRVSEEELKVFVLNHLFR